MRADEQPEADLAQLLSMLGARGTKSAGETVFGHLKLPDAGVARIVARGGQGRVTVQVQLPLGSTADGIGGRAVALYASLVAQQVPEDVEVRIESEPRPVFLIGGDASPSEARSFGRRLVGLARATMGQAAALANGRDATLAETYLALQGLAADAGSSQTRKGGSQDGDDHPCA